ncbi:MAG: SRPBCC family protein [Taibaiella sp.]|nr:SRPBCC family protein [Taibaiella sp.]
MSIVMTILAVIAAVVALFLLVAAVTGKEMKIERSITVNKPVNEVFNFVSHIKNHEQFSVWHMMDPQMKKEYRGTDGQVGFVYAWDSANDKNVGAGKQEITKLIPDQRVEFHLRFLRPMQMKQMLQ